MLAILEYGAGNQTSVARAFSHLGIPCRITSDPEEIMGSSGIIFPGVGAAPQAMRELARTGMDKVLAEAAHSKKPLLGICLGSQILLEKSEEGQTGTLALFPGVCRHFKKNMTEADGSPVKIPHMGWNKLHKKRECVLLKNIPDDSHFYFVHSYYIDPPADLIIATSRHGHEFCAVYGTDGLWGVQFHPEKSGRQGLKIMENFYSWCRNQ